MNGNKWIIDNLKDKYNGLNPSAKRIAKGLAILASLIVIYGLFSMIFGGGDKKEPVVQEQKLINKDITSAGDKELSDRIALKRELEEFRHEIDLEMNTIRAENEILKKQNTALTDRIKMGDQSDGNDQRYPPAPGAEGLYSSQSSGGQRQVKIESVGGIRRLSAAASLTEVQPVGQEKLNYFPTTTYIKGVLLNGLYAPTLSKGKSNPHPAFIRIEDISILPNNLPRDIEGCELMGDAYGELSDSRVHIRLTKMACTAYDGSKYFDDNVKGVVMGEDGTLGVPGVVRANFNKLLVHSFFMESMAGLGKALQQMSTTTIISPEGTAQQYIEGSGTDQMGKVLMASGGQGLGAGFQRIAEFYLNMLNEMSPVIQINGGRHIEVKFTEGVELKLQPNSWSWGEVL
ncbi:MAG: TraB/VirB10 family protein [Deferribacteraceae bacterium]|jgi:conjugal transfer pilus assembly protein TraB|nr:TraB/VirB10 family protein [Deferribacteraceae bacterium]